MSIEETTVQLVKIAIGVTFAAWFMKWGGEVVALLQVIASK